MIVQERERESILRSLRHFVLTDEEINSIVTSVLTAQAALESVLPNCFLLTLETSKLSLEADGTSPD